VNIQPSKSHLPSFLVVENNEQSLWMILQVKIFEDEDGIRREEIAALRGQDMYRYPPPPLIFPLTILAKLACLPHSHFSARMVDSQRNCCRQQQMLQRGCGMRFCRVQNFLRAAERSEGLPQTACFHGLHRGNPFPPFTVHVQNYDS